MIRAAVLALVIALPAHAARRALVIGNAAYSEGALANPVHDASAVADKLRALGFEVRLVTDANLRVLQKAISAYSNKLHSGDESFVFYAGHGVQIKGENFLLPVDFKADTEADAEFAAYRMDQLFANLEDKRLAVSVLVLDACRDNPFRSTRSASRGLRIVQSGAGSVVAFATSPGKTAMDNGADGHSVFTAALLEHLGDRDDLAAVLTTVQREVAKQTNKAQVPWTSIGLTDAYYLAGEPEKAAQRVAHKEEPKPAAHRATTEECEGDCTVVARNDASAQKLPENYNPAANPLVEPCFYRVKGGDIDGGIADCLSALAKNPDVLTRAQLYRILATAHAGKGENAEAVKYLRLYLPQAPNSDRPQVEQFLKSH